MRLNKNQAEYAARELIEILKIFPNGLPTKDLMGTPRFHG